MPAETATKPCHKCKGTKKLTITVHEGLKDVGGKKMDLTCIYCEGTGVETGKKFLEDLLEWCSCEAGPSEYSDHSREHGTDIYRCQTCGGVVQVG